MKKFEEMTVKELREESRTRGLHLEANGKKFKKAELIQNIEEYDKQHSDKSEKAAAEPVKEKAPEQLNEKSNKEIKRSKSGREIVGEYITYAKTLKEIVQKYGGRKKQSIYDNMLKIGSFVVFVHYVEAKDGEIYKKLRTAKVKEIDRWDEFVVVETILGTELKLNFTEILYIKEDTNRSSYPKDIDMYLHNQRTAKGRELLNEKYSGSNMAN